MINWNEGENWLPITTPGIKGDYGSFHVYAFTMTIGMLLAIAYSFYKFKKRDLPVETLIIGVTLIIPFSLLGASFFGKLNADGPGNNAGGVGFWGLFAFWHGGMSIHGGVYSGLLVGIIIFGFLGPRYKVSLWTYLDAIVPNILLGQVVGRWGNFFNHELVGFPIKFVGHVTQWSGLDGLIDFDSLGLSWTGTNGWLWKNTMSLYQGPSTTINGLSIEPGDVYQMLPIFLVESVALFAVWLIVTFVIPNIGKLFGPKPWKIAAQTYPFSWKWTWEHFFAPWKKNLQNLTFQQTWNQAFVFHTDQKARQIYQERYQNPVSLTFKQRWNQGCDLIKANNPHHYWVTKAGCEGSAYFFGWNLVRFCLEMGRPDDHLFVMFNKPLSLTLIGLSAFLGLLGMVLTQVGIPQLTRRPGWAYEKNYFFLIPSESSLSSVVTGSPQKNKSEENASHSSSLSTS